MSNVLVPGTVAAEPGTMTRAILDVFESLLDPTIFAASETGLARFSNAIAVGVCANIVASITDTKYLQVDGGEIVGGDGGGGGPPEAHASTHENGGDDEINVAGLSGELADPQPPKTHAGSHENGGGDELDVTGLSGLLADPQTPVPTAGVDTTAIHDNVAGEIAAITLKATPNKNDLFLLEDSQDGNAKKRATLGTFPAVGGIDATAFHSDVAGEFVALTNKAVPTTSDVLAIEDAAAGNAKKKITVGALPFVAVTKVTLTQGVTAGVPFEVTRVTIPEGWAGRLKYEWALWGGTAASPLCAYTNDGVLNVTRATGGVPVIEDVTATNAARGTTYSLSTAVSGNDVVWSVTIGSSVTIGLSGETITTGAPL